VWSIKKAVYFRAFSCVVVANFPDSFTLYHWGSVGWLMDSRNS
jgi:hypothetical protein